MSLPSDTGPAIDPSTYLHHDRDVRIDFFRGVALLFIFIDHIPRNFLAFFTLHNFGFSDAAEMFVGLAGYAAFFAYTKPFERKGLLAGLRKIGQLGLTAWKLAQLKTAGARSGPTSHSRPYLWPHPR